MFSETFHRSASRAASSLAEARRLERSLRTRRCRFSFHTRVVVSFDGGHQIRERSRRPATLELQDEKGLFGALPALTRDA